MCNQQDKRLAYLLGSVVIKPYLQMFHLHHSHHIESPKSELLIAYTSTDFPTLHPYLINARE